MSRQPNRQFLLIAFIALAGISLADNLRGPLYPEFLANYNLRDSEGNYFFLLSNIVNIAVNFAVGFWLPRLGIYRAMLLWLGALIASCILIGTSSSLFGVYAGICSLGLGMAGIGIINSELVVRGSKPEERTRAFSAFHLGYAIISILTPLMVSMSLKLGWAWNRVYLFNALIPILLILALPYVLKNSHTELVLAHENKQNTQLGTKAVSKAFLLWAALTPTAYMIAEQLVSSRLVLLLRTSMDYSVDNANGLLSAYAAAFFAGRAYLTLFKTKIASQTLCIISAAGTVITYLLALSIHPIFFVGVGLFQSVFFPAFNAFTLEGREASVAKIQSWTAIACALGMIVFNGSFGHISDFIGIQKGFAIVGLSLATVVLLSLYLKKFRFD